jgi:hypothetical protein
VIYLDLCGNGRSEPGPPDKWSLEIILHTAKQIIIRGARNGA